MARSGDIVDLTSIPGIKVDKHSTGGVGDKTSLVVAPIVASCGVPVAKMSGRGLGHTGGTIDMSKKLAAGSDAILLDVKTGSGAFMKTLDDSIALAQEMVSIGEHMGVALITDMDIPLGFAIGNALEVIEAVDTLQGRGPADLTEVCLQISANMLYLAGKGSLENCHKLARDAVASGCAFDKLKCMVTAQGGSVSVLENTTTFAKAPVVHEVCASRGGYVTKMDTERCGIASVALGAGRVSKGDTIDYSAGILLRKKVGDRVDKGEPLAQLFTAKQSNVAEAENILQDALTISAHGLEPAKLIYARVTKDSVEKY